MPGGHNCHWHMFNHWLFGEFWEPGDPHWDAWPTDWIAGVDCSGFVCNCLWTNNPDGTYHQVGSSKIRSELLAANQIVQWELVQLGDVVVRNGHCMLVDRIEFPNHVPTIYMWESNSDYEDYLNNKVRERENEVQWLILERYIVGSYYRDHNFINDNIFDDIENSIDGRMPASLQLYCFPNPFNNIFSLYYDIQGHESVSLRLYNVLGQLQETVYKGTRDPGTYKLNADMSDYSSGIYFLVMTTNTRSISRKILLIK